MRRWSSLQLRGATFPSCAIANSQGRKLAPRLPWSSCVRWYNQVDRRSMCRRDLKIRSQSLPEPEGALALQSRCGWRAKVRTWRVWAGRRKMRRKQPTRLTPHAQARRKRMRLTSPIIPTCKESANKPEQFRAGQYSGEQCRCDARHAQHGHVAGRLGRGVEHKPERRVQFRVGGTTVDDQTAPCSYY